MLFSDFHNYLQHPEALDEDSLPLLKSLVQQYPAFQAAWMLLLKNLKTLNDPEFDDYLKLGAIRVADRRRLYYFLMQEGQSGDTAQSADELDFLSKEYLATGAYQLNRHEEQEESLADLVKSFRKKQVEKEALEPEASENANFDKKAESEFVTETLAKIYARQGLYKQAILAYEKLSLKYPEKNTYFAGQIEEIKRLMN
ncbi:MAG: hypothetical protein AB7U05_03670 [Mangrovibacterium sp.]